MAVQFGKSKTGPGKPSGAPAVAGAKKAASSGPKKLFSLLPEDWVSGGLLNDADVTIKEMFWVDDWTYGGKVEVPVLALKVVFAVEGGDDVEQFFSAGDVSRIVPTEDGKGITNAEDSSATALNNNTNATTFLQSIIDVGFPKNEVTPLLTCFEGMQVHVMRVPQKKRTGLASPDDKQRDVLTVTKILRLPSEGKGKAATATAATKTAGKAMTAAAGAGSAAVSSNGGGADVDGEELVGIINAVLEDKGGSVAFKALSLGALKHLAGNANKSAIIAELKNPDTLAALAEAEQIGFDGDTVTAA